MQGKGVTVICVHVLCNLCWRGKILKDYLILPIDMDIDGPMRELGALDTTALRDAILGQEDIAWHEDESRQESFYVHDRTRSIILIALDDSNWPNGQVRRGPGWERLTDVALPVMQEIIKNHYAEGGEVIRAVAASLTAGAIIKAHSDIHQSFHVIKIT